MLSVTIEEGEPPTAKVVVPNAEASLAIGQKGQNAKLAAKLTGYKIDIKKEIPDPEDVQPEESDADADELPAGDE